MKLKKKKDSSGKHQGFTLIEIIMTILVVSVVSTLAIANLNKAILVDRERNAVARLQALMGAMRIYKAKTGSYPAGVRSDYDTEIKALIGTDLIQEPYDISCVGDDGFGGSNQEINCFISYPPNTLWTAPGRWGLAYQTANFDPKYSTNPEGKVFCEDDPCRYCASTGCP